MWQQYNPNPSGHNVGDCTVRAITVATDDTWTHCFIALALEGLILGDMPSANRTWGAYLERCGFRRRMVESECHSCYTVRDFCRDHPTGVYVLAISGHVVGVKDGDWWDSWDSGDCIPIYYWCKGKEES